MLRHTLTQRKLKPKAQGYCFLTLKSKDVKQPRYSAGMFPFHAIHPLTVRNSYQKAPSQVYTHTQVNTQGQNEVLTQDTTVIMVCHHHF